MVERMTLNHVVAGSIPAVGVKSQWSNLLCVDSSMVRIRAFQARGPGSIPGRRTCQVSFVLGNMLGAWMAEWSKAADLSSVIFGCVGSNPTSGNLFISFESKLLHYVPK